MLIANCKTICSNLKNLNKMSLWTLSEIRDILYLDFGEDERICHAVRESKNHSMAIFEKSPAVVAWFIFSGVREGELYSLESRSALLPSSPFCQIVQLSDFYSPALQCMVSHPPPKRDIECHVLLLSGTKEKNFKIEKKICVDFSGQNCQNCQKNSFK